MTSSTSCSSSSGLKREDELKFKELKQRVTDNGLQSLTKDEMLWYSLLEDRYARFLEEGIKKLKEMFPAPSKGGSGGGSSSHNNASLSSPHSKRSTTNGGPNEQSAASPTSESLSSSMALDDPSETPLQVAAHFGGSFSNPVFIPNGAGISGNHWTWLADNVITGAIPYVSPTSDTAGHLSELSAQLKARHSVLAVVVSLLEFDETIPAGFAQHERDWDQHLSSTTSFLRLAFPADEHQPMDASLLAETVAVCSQVYQVTQPAQNKSMSGAVGGGDGSSAFSTGIKGGFAALRSRLSMVGRASPASQTPSSIRKNLTYPPASPSNPRNVAFIHCKTGRRRSWVFCMCYFMSQHHASFEEAESYLMRARPQWTPSPQQIEFVQRFKQFVTVPVVKQVSADDERYFKVLAEVLSLPPSYRQRLLNDLENLT